MIIREYTKLQIRLLLDYLFWIFPTSRFFLNHQKKKLHEAQPFFTSSATHELPSILWNHMAHYRDRNNLPTLITSYSESGELSPKPQARLPIRQWDSLPPPPPKLCVNSSLYFMPRFLSISFSSIIHVILLRHVNSVRIKETYSHS
jgi:hypothetical protein